MKAIQIKTAALAAFVLIAITATVIVFNDHTPSDDPVPEVEFMVNDGDVKSERIDIDFASE